MSALVLMENNMNARVSVPLQNRPFQRVIIVQFKNDEMQQTFAWNRERL